MAQEVLMNWVGRSSCRGQENQSRECVGWALTSLDSSIHTPF